MSMLQFSAMSENAVFSKSFAQEIDIVIRNIPAHQLTSPDHAMPGLDPAVSINPFTCFGRLRDRGQDVVQYIDGRYEGVRAYNAFGRDLSQPNFAVLGYRALREVATDKERFINADAYGAHGKGQNAGFTFVNELDGEEHKFMRRLFESQVLSRTYFENLVETTIGPVVDFLVLRIREMLDTGERVELNRDLALPLAYISISRIIGIPIVDLSYFVDLADRVFAGPRDLTTAAVAAAELDAYFGKVYRDRLAVGDLDKGDLMSLMSSADLEGRRFTEREVIVYSRFMLPAAIETTWRQMANLGYALMLHPEQYELVCRDEQHFGAAIEEALRWMPSGFILPRTAAVDTVLAGVAVPAGSSLYGVFGVANRDPRIWDNPDAFDIRRERKPHLTFSTGQHTCMGQHLARVSLANYMRAVTSVLPDMILDGDPSSVRSTGFLVRCADAVPVKSRFRN